MRVESPEGVMGARAAARIERAGELRAQMIARGDRRVARGTLGRAAARHAFYERVVVRLVEEHEDE
jgi:demethoxyubiquinone hydroxylase (CLK1/Coq7/Cat5 family)